MRLRMKECLGLAGAATLAGGAALSAGAWKWKRATAATLAELRASRAAEPRPRYDPVQLKHLPPVVLRYFELALQPDQPIVGLARIEHAGEFRMKPGGAAAPFVSVEEFTADPPGFVWDARISVAPGVVIRVRDGFLEGTASLDARVAGLVPLARGGGTPELASGALMRWLAEAVWFPTALLPSNGVVWTGVDASTARATLTHGTTHVSINVRFGSCGAIRMISADRYRDVDGKGVRTPWRVCLADYERRHGMMIPTTGRVEWELPGGPWVYWAGRVETAEYAWEEMTD